MKEKFMKEALKEGQKAFDNMEVPIGCVIVKDGKIIGKGRNRKEELKDPTAHSEILAIKDATKTIGHWWLEDCDVYVTLEPCPMCAGALLNARVRKVYIGAKDKRMGALGSSIDLSDFHGSNHKLEVEFSILEKESKALLRSFFKKLREKK